MQYGPKIVTNGLVLCLDAADRKSYSGSGTAWTDLSGNNRTGVLTNGPTFNSSNGGSVVFDGSNDCVVIDSNASILSTTAYTKIAWFYATSFATSNNIVSSGGTGQHALWLAGSNKLYSGHNGAWTTTVASNTTLSLNTWYFGAVTFNTTSGWVLYLNGIQGNTNASTTTFTGNGEISVGAYAGGNFFTGRIACALVYNRVLTASEILQNFNTTKARFDR